MKAVILFHWLFAACTHARVAKPSSPPPIYDELLDNGTYGFYPTHSYISAPEVKPPDVNFLQWSPQCDDGLLYFFTPRGHSLSNNEPRPGPMILDAHGELVWAHHFENLFGGQAYDLMVQNYQGEDYLTFWLGDDTIKGHGSGFYYMLNSSYDIVHKVGASNGMSADLHEFLITPQGTVLMTIYEIIPGDVSMLRTFNAELPEDQNPNWIWDCVFQEIDIATGDLIFEWRASEHVNITETYREIGGAGTQAEPFDWFHLNSIQKDELGNYLISARYPHSITYIDGKTQEKIWQLGGKGNMFMDLSHGNATNFAWQHDARFLATDSFPHIYSPPADKFGSTTKLLTIFDNAAEDQHYHFGLPMSRGLVLEVTYPTPDMDRKLSGPLVTFDPVDDLSKRDDDPELDENQKKLMAINGTNENYTVRVVQSYENPFWVRSSSQGSMQVLPQDEGEDPKIFIGYGLNAVWTEFEADGTVLCDAHFGANVSWERGDIQSYRAYKQEWTGRPQWSPNAEIINDEDVYVSWLGATDVLEWRLQCSRSGEDDEMAWADLLRVPKHKFETAIPLPEEVGGARYLRVIALGDNSQTMDYGISNIIDRGILASHFRSLHRKLPSSVTAMSPLTVFLLIIFNGSLLVMLYEAYRKYLSWRRAPSAGAFRWRKGVAYRLLGDA